MPGRAALCMVHLVVRVGFAAVFPCFTTFFSFTTFLFHFIYLDNSIRFNNDGNYIYTM